MGTEQESSFDYPILRGIDVAPVLQGGRPLMMLHDPSRLSEQTLVVPQDILYVLQFFDGQHSLLDIRAEYMRKFGTFLFEDRLKQLVADLDSLRFLENENFEEHRRSLVEAFQKAPVRKSLLAGNGYPADPDRLREELRAYFAAQDGPGLPNSESPSCSVKGIIAPHIDLRAGGRCYAHAYKAIAESIQADLYVILGTCHSPLAGWFAATRKDFETPFGVVRTDGEFVSELESSWEGDLFQDELMHRGEHTIELQLVFLQYVLKNNFRIAPILCSFSHEEVGKEASGEEAQRGFFDALRKANNDYPGRVCFIASADFSHVGARYGDRRPPDASFMSLVRRSDLDMLERLEALDAEGFREEVTRTNNKFRVCGFPPIYTMLKAMNAEKGRILKYDSAAVDSTGSAVTFASVVYE